MGEWESRWREGRIGFHKTEVQPMLVRHAEVLLAGNPQRVFVPLCGKSVDLPWLAERVPEVVGNELIPEAVAAFFEEQGLEPTSEPAGALTRRQSGRITLFEGDCFDLTPELAGTFPAIYDRAALIALPPEGRPRYASRLLSLLAPGGVILLITLHGPQPPEQGPPYCVAPEEVTALFGNATTLERLETISHTPSSDGLMTRRGLAWLEEHVFCLQKLG
jgi:thiopurine S-methyltransferase